MANEFLDEILNGTPELVEGAIETLNAQDLAAAEQAKLLDGADEVEAANAVQTSESPQDSGSTEPAQPVEEAGNSGLLSDQFLAEASKVIKQDQEEKLAIPFGVVDFAVDSINTIGNIVLRDPGVTIDDSGNFHYKKGAVNIPKLPKFESKLAQATREISSVVAPNIFFAGRALQGARALNAANISRQGLGWKLGSDKAFQWFASTGLTAGVGAGVDYVSEASTDDNLTGTLKKSWPRTYSWVSDDWATLDSDSPDVKRNKNINEGIFAGLFSDFLQGAAKLFKIRKGVKEVTKWIPENEKAKNAKVWKEDPEDFLSDDPVENTVLNSAKRRTEALDETGAYNYSNSDGQLNQPIFGLHEAYDAVESGSRSADPKGVLGASVDAVRIDKNIDTVYGRLGSVMTEGAIKFSNKAGDAGQAVIRGLKETLIEAGEYGYRTDGGRYISHKEVMQSGEKIAADLLEMDVSEMKRTLRNLSDEDFDTGLTELGSEAYAGVMKAIGEYTKEFANMDHFRAAGYVATSTAGQISDMAQASRLANSVTAVSRAQEQVLDRIEFLMQVKGQTSYVRGRALNMLNLWKMDPKKAKEAVKNTKQDTLDKLKEISEETSDTIDTLRAVKEQRPEMLGPLMLAYDITDGSVSSMSKLNQYVRNTTGTVSKMFFDSRPDLESVWLQGVWSNIYNSVLSSLSTPLKATFSNIALMIERPIATYAGAMMSGDGAILRKAHYMYTVGIGETLGRSFNHMSQVFKRASADPASVGYIMRDDIVRKNEDKIALLNSFAEAAEQRGESAPKAMMVQVEAMNDLAEHPMLRFSANAMTAFDGFTRSFIANIEARGRAYDTLMNAGDKVTANRVRAMARNTYGQMFDESGMITDEAVDYASREIAMNLEAPFLSSINALLSRAPVFKPFMMFPKTATSILAFTRSHTPLGKFVRDVDTFSVPYQRQSKENVRYLLEARGVPYSPETAEAAYNTIRAELKGRRAIGTLSVLGAGTLFTGDRLRGNGLHDKEKQKLRREANWKPRTYMGLDGKWYSYDNLGAISDWLALTADIMDHFDTLDEPSLELMLNKAGHILAANLTNKSFLAGLEPMNDVLAGNPASLSRWGASFLSGLVPGSGFRNEFARLMTPQLKEMEQDFLQLLANRNPVFKDQLPDVYDWIDGGKVGEPSNFFQRAWNTYSPFMKQSDSLSDEKQFLIDIEFDARPTLSTNGKGVELTPEMRSQITNEMGKNGGFKQAIREVMNTTEGRNFREQWKEAARSGIYPKLADYKNVHRMLTQRLRAEQKYAMSRVELAPEIAELEFTNNQIEEATRLGQIERIRQLQNN